MCLVQIMVISHIQNKFAILKLCNSALLCTKCALRTRSFRHIALFSPYASFVSKVLGMFNYSGLLNFADPQINVFSLRKL